MSKFTDEEIFEGINEALEDNDMSMADGVDTKLKEVIKESFDYAVFFLDVQDKFDVEIEEDKIAADTYGDIAVKQLIEFIQEK